ncbi:MAG: ABC transporter ATP-binding protein, partial [Pseudonocardiaceae bacterium]
MTISSPGRNGRRSTLPLLGFGRLLGNTTGQRAADFWGSSRRLVTFMRPELGYTVAVLLFGALSILLNVLGPRILGYATDLLVAAASARSDPAGFARLRGSGLSASLADRLDAATGLGTPMATLAVVLAGAALCYATSGLLWVAQGRFLTHVIQRSMHRLRGRVQDKLARLPLRYLDSTPRGEVLGCTTNDIDNLAQSLQQTMSQVTVTPLLIVGTFVMMVSLYPLLALLSLLVVPLSVGVTRVVGRRAQDVFVEQWSLTCELNGAVEDAYSGHSTIVSTHSAARFREDFARRNAAVAEAAACAQAISGALRPLIAFVGSLNYVLVAVVGGIAIATGRMSVGAVQAFIQYTRQFSQPVTQVAGIANYLQSGVASAERVFAFLDEPDEPAPAVTSTEPEGGGPDRGTVAGAIEFSHVSFGYDQDRPFIKDLSFSVRAHSTVAIVGPTGAGKTTLVNLLLRFYEPCSGSITLDGENIAEIPRGRLRSCIATVPQHTWLFCGTIAENIAFGAPWADADRIRHAARLAHADRFIRTKAQGYYTVIDGDAADLSAGEKQLIAIARAFLVDAPVLVLDEATSSVDSATELDIRRGLARLSSGRTTLVVAHRLSTIRDADRVLVLE